MENGHESRISRDVSAEPNYRAVLDKGFVRLVSFHGDDLLPARTARVSYGKESKGEEKDKKLMRFLAEHRHEGPFEFLEFMFHVKAPLFVVRQWQRHRIAEYNELSGRYVTFEHDQHWVPTFGRAQDKYRKQGSARPDYLELSADWSTPERERIPDIGAWHDAVAREIQVSCEAAYETYRRLVDHYGVSREMARTVLPLGSYTEFYCKMNGRSMANFLSLRAADDAQEEIREYARAILSILSVTHPFFIEVVEEHWMRGSS